MQVQAVYSASVQRDAENLHCTAVAMLPWACWEKLWGDRYWWAFHNNLTQQGLKENSGTKWTFGLITHWYLV